MVKHVDVQVDWLGHVQIIIEEALPLASAKIDNKIYEINDAGKITYITNQKRIQSLKLLPIIENFQSLNLLSEFAKEFKEVPTLMQNEISEIILEPRKNDEFNYAAYKSEYKNKCTFSLEGENIYLLPCE